MGIVADQRYHAPAIRPDADKHRHLCDWHYGQRATYPSVPLLLLKGFRVWPAGFQPLEATKAFSDYSRKERALSPRLVGYLCTTWSQGKPDTVAAWPPVKEILQDWKMAETVKTNDLSH